MYNSSFFAGDIGQALIFDSYVGLLDDDALYKVSEVENEEVLVVLAGGFIYLVLCCVRFLGERSYMVGTLEGCVHFYVSICVF